jgi:hypothetical protein
MPSRKPIFDGKSMLSLFLILALIFLIGGGAGLFYVNINMVAGSDLWIYGNITFGVFVAVAIVIIIFAAMFNAEFD